MKEFGRYTPSIHGAVHEDSGISGLLRDLRKRKVDAETLSKVPRELLEALRTLCEHQHFEVFQESVRISQRWSRLLHFADPSPQALAMAAKTASAYWRIRSKVSAVQQQKGRLAGSPLTVERALEEVITPKGTLNRDEVNKRILERQLLPVHRRNDRTTKALRSLAEIGKERLRNHLEATMGNRSKTLSVAN